ncbi:MAG: chitobiase/beta-hexosaminidase C-terminal domain-containing protein [Desulfotomaculaceae bacterium]|nr:chitobiase/beta-hexosaminidase C-terminal domain-containing protein [Desulfotomaculaceae bacterium]
MHRLLKAIGLLAVLLVACLSLLTGCQGQNQNQPPAATVTTPESTGQETGNPGSEPGILTITGNGVEHETKFTLDELKSMQDALAGACYSAVNNWPAKKFIVGKGVQVSHLLQKAGIKEDAKTIVFRAADGYNASFTREQLDEKRFYFPNLMKYSTEGAVEVPSILAWEYEEDTSDLSEATSGKLRLLIGQITLHDVATAAFVKGVTTIEVLTAPPGQWSTVKAEPAPGKVKPGTEVVLSHPQKDLVKIYYTLDGSAPDVQSLLYNPSTSYFQPDLNKPIPVNQPVTIKAVAIGCGKYNSQVATFKYE